MALPIREVNRPLCLLGQSNGRLPDTLLETTPGQQGGPPVHLVQPAARAWRALQAAALASGHVLKATSAVDSYRPYSVQERIFRQRYTTSPLRGRSSRSWNGVRWYQKPGTAAAAVPGTSNHGWALAVDTGVELDGDAGTESLDRDTLDWLLANAAKFGWSWELQSEPWHLRYFAGDCIPAAVLDHEGDDDMAWTDDDSENLKAIRADNAEIKTLLQQINHHISANADKGGRLARITAVVEDLVKKP